MARAIDAEKLKNEIKQVFYGTFGLTVTGAVHEIIDRQPTLIQPNEPLTLEELRQMDGKPVWVEDVDHWALVDIEKGGEWDGVPFAIWTENGVSFYYNVIDRNLLCYRRPPEGEEEP